MINVSFTPPRLSSLKVTYKMRVAYDKCNLLQFIIPQPYVSVGSFVSPSVPLHRSDLKTSKKTIFGRSSVSDSPDKVSMQIACIFDSQLVRARLSCREFLMNANICRFVLPLEKLPEFSDLFALC